jgi:hypothetical protein
MSLARGRHAAGEEPDRAGWGREAGLGLPGRASHVTDLGFWFSGSHRRAGGRRRGRPGGGAAGAS